MMNLTETIMTLEGWGVNSWFDKMKGREYAHKFGIEFNGTNTTELAQALIDQGKATDRYSVRKMIPRTDQNAIMKALYGMRLY